jgi:hypothetical protein
MKIIRRIVIEITDKEVNLSKSVRSNIAIIRDMKMTPEIFDCQVSRPTAHCIGRAHNALMGKQSERLADKIKESLKDSKFAS